MAKPLELIVACAENRVIGDHGAIPWSLPGELAHFKATTMGHTMLMGRATFEGIGRVLPGRRTIVLTRDPGWQHSDVEAAASLPEALALIDDPKLHVDVPSITYFLGRETVVSNPDQGMHPVREQIFMMQNRTAASAARFFSLPSKSVFEVGTTIEI